MVGGLVGGGSSNRGWLGVVGWMVVIVLVGG